MSTSEQTHEQHILDTDRYFAHNYDRYPIVVDRARGMDVWDYGDKLAYQDWLGTYGAATTGHAHPKIVEAAIQQLRTGSIMLSQRVYHTKQARLGELLAEATGHEKFLLLNSGSEAVELFLKLSRRYGREVRGIPENEGTIIYCAGAFHGRTIAETGMLEDEDYVSGFGPFPPGFTRIDYDDVELLERELDAKQHVLSVLVEPIQAEHGMISPSDGYLQRIVEICRSRGVLVGFDEIQTGLGKTGDWLAAEHDGVKPDFTILAKALGGNVAKVSAVCTSRKIMEVIRPGSHGSTFGGTPFDCAVATASLEVIRDEGLVEKAAEMGNYLEAEIANSDLPHLREIRGRGLMRGLVFDPDFLSSKEIGERLLAEHIIAIEAHDALRLTPPVANLTDARVDRLCFALKKVMGPREI